MLLCPYYRFSPRPSAQDCDSIEWQRDFVSRWAASRQRTIDREFSDEDASGCSLENRDDLVRCLAYCKEHKREMVCYSLSRCARNLRDLLNIQFDLASSGSRLTLLDQPDLDSEAGEISLIINGYVAQKYLRDLRRATSDGMQQKQRAGLLMSGKPPYGFSVRLETQWTPKGEEIIRFLDPVPAEQAILEEMYRLDKMGFSAREIRDCLGRPWRTRQIKNILARRLPVLTAAAPA